MSVGLDSRLDEYCKWSCPSGSESQAAYNERSAYPYYLDHLNNDGFSQVN